MRTLLLFALLLFASPLSGADISDAGYVPPDMGILGCNEDCEITYGCHLVTRTWCDSYATINLTSTCQHWTTEYEEVCCNYCQCAASGGGVVTNTLWCT